MPTSESTYPIQSGSNKDFSLSKTIISNQRAKDTLADTFNEIISGLIHGGEVKISSFGTFKTINKKKRIGRNPKTRVEAIISARKVVVFRASNLLKKKINQWLKIT